MRTLAEINKERSKLINEAMGMIIHNREYNRRYNPGELSEMCEGLIPPEKFRECFRRAEYQARMDASPNRHSRQWRSEKSHLFGWWGLEFKAYPVTRKCEVKWYDENGKVLKTTKQYIADYEVEFF
jgi:hypothetical protein